MQELLKELFLKTYGEPASAAALPGDGSDRKLFRLAGAGRSVIGAVNADAKENAAFISFSRHFRKCGLPVPEIYAEDLQKGIYLEEDLGYANLFQLLTKLRAAGAPRSALFPREALEVYRKAVKLLPKFQIDAGQTLDYSKCYPRAEFDRQSMMWDLNYFKYYFLRLAKIPFNEQALEDDFNRFTDFLLEAQSGYFLYRDFQSRNIMVREGEPWFIDYQGGRRGALQYDIASLLFDAKADIPFDIREELLELYLDTAAGMIKIDREKFRAHYYGYVYIRIMQAMGAYGLRGFYEKKLHFLQSIPYAVKNLEYLSRKAKLPLELPAFDGVWRNIIASSYLRQFGAARPGLTVRVQSFSYRVGLPRDDKGHGGGFVFDCRALPNPGRCAEYAPFTGMDAPVIKFLAGEPEAARFLKNVRALTGQSVENYRKRNFTDLLVSFGCTGGRHRSVYCAETLAKHLREKYDVEVEITHAALRPATSPEFAARTA
ncbi:MAG: RNase adapter RapZ [Elusimicrobiales bacterium]|nr:RNase adapter RapZ [Elusimicrobiales bacterium]